MKQKLIGVAVVAAIAVTAGWNFNQSKNEMAMSDLVLANVEALARGEGSDGDCNQYCSSSYNYDCILDYVHTGERVVCSNMRKK